MPSETPPSSTQTAPFTELIRSSASSSMMRATSAAAVSLPVGVIDSQWPTRSAELGKR